MGNSITLSTDVLPYVKWGPANLTSQADFESVQGFVDDPAWGNEYLSEAGKASRSFDYCAQHRFQESQRQPLLIPVDDTAAIAEAFQSFGREISAKLEVELRVGILEKVVLELRYSLAEFISQRTIQVPVISLEPEPFRLRQTLYFVVRPNGDEFSATFFDANLNASGDTEFEAVENLKEIIVSSFRRLTELGPERLGPGPLKQFSVLKSVMEKC